MNRTQYIQQLIDERGYTSFLEIGYGDGKNFNDIKCAEKTAIDPDPKLATVPGIFNDTSDAFFDQLDGRKKFSIIFIDGLHHADQVERDIVNAYKHLKKGGVILIHDINPRTYECTIVPRAQREWCGTVFQAWHGLIQHHHYSGLRWSHMPDDYGIGKIEYTEGVKIEPGFVSDISYDQYKSAYFAS